ncbi:UNVERIFIED_CONTAM: hypothetical protein GTU68_066292 [Idotea baltica]|nr:hypothetical protein [Idotea baltica]
MQISTNLLTLYKRSFTKTWLTQRWMVGYKTYF